MRSIAAAAERRAAEVRVQDHARRIDDRSQRRRPRRVDGGNGLALDPDRRIVRRRVCVSALQPGAQRVRGVSRGVHHGVASV